MIGFKFNNIESSTYNIICKSVNRPLLPPLRQKTIEILGRAGVYDYGNDTYDTRLITIHIFFARDTIANMRLRAREIAAWLGQSQWSKLIFGDETDKYYAAKIYEQVDLKTLIATGETDITFECQPYAYSVTDTGIDEDYQFTVTAETELEFVNPGTVTINKKSPQGSKSQIKVVGTWTNITLTSGTKTLTFSEAALTSKTLIIDNVNMECTLDGVNKLSQLTGNLDDFIYITPGDNAVTITGTAINVTVTIDFTPMWL